MKKLYFMLCVAFFATFLWTKSYSQNVIFDLANAVLENNTWTQTKSGHKLLISPSGGPLKLSSSATTLNNTQHLVSDPTVGGITFNIEGFHFNANSISLRKTNGQGTIYYILYNGSTFITSAGVSLADNVTTTLNFGGYQVSSIYISSYNNSPMTIAFDDINLSNIVDITPPRINSVTSSTPDGLYKVGDEISIQVNFSENVIVTGAPTLALATGNSNSMATYVSGSGTKTLNFKYIVEVNHQYDRSLDYLSTDAIKLNSGSIKDASGNNATLTLNRPGDGGSLGYGRGIQIDGVAPTVASVTSSAQDRAYGIGEVIPIHVVFAEKVTVTGIPQLQLETGSTDRTINYKSGTGSTTLQFDYTVQAGDVSSDLNYVSTSALVFNGGSIKDWVGNEAVLTLPLLNGTTSLAANKNIVIDGIVPTVNSVSSSKANGTYKIGDVIDIEVNFSEAVSVGNTPQLEIKIGDVNRKINYSSGSGTSILKFNYTVLSGDASPKLDYASTSALALNNGSIKDLVGNTAVLTLPIPGGTNSLGANKTIVIDGIEPKVVSVSSSAANKAYKIGDVIDVQVNFSKNMVVQGTPQLSMRTGTTSRKIDYFEGSGTSTLTFKYTVQAGDRSSDLDYEDANALSLNAGTIRDALGNNAILTLPLPGAANSLAANKDIVIDGDVPTVASVSSSMANGTYSAVTAIDIQVNFSEPVMVTGTPQLTLKVGTPNRIINYSSGSGTSTLTFKYVVKPEDSSADLDYAAANALSLNAGTIRDLAGNNAALTLASPGASGSLGANKNIIIVPIAPNADGVLFVKKGGNGNGSAWASPMGELADALVVAKTLTSVKQVWVAAGTYYPLYSPADNNFGDDAGRHNAFLLVKDKKIYGGFAGTETNTKQRDTISSSNKTILSGDIGVAGVKTDNAYHVVLSSGDAGTAIFNGFTVTDGNADGPVDITVNSNLVSQRAGGGIHHVASSPILMNIVVSGNSANNVGGGIYNSSLSSPVLTNVAISGNSAVVNGGGVANSASSPKLTNVIISNNSVSNNGAGIFNIDSSSPILTNVAIIGNKAVSGGGAIYNANTSSPVLTNVTLGGNSAFTGGGLYNTNASSPKLYNSIVYGNSSGVGNSSSTPVFYNSIIQGSGGSSSWLSTVGTNGGNNLDIDPKFVNAPSSSTAPFVSGNYSLQAASPAIDAGDNHYYGGLVATTVDFIGKPRVYDYANNGIIDMGAYEYQSPIRTNINNVLFVKKGATGNGSSWENAFGELADALKVAKEVVGLKEIWVAKGTYYPLYSPLDNNFGTNADRENAFLLVKDIKIYGGFAGTETATSQRDMVTWVHKSILSGDIGIAGNPNDNTYHVVVSSGDVGAATLDGFTITGGSTGGSNTSTINSNTFYRVNGGGIYNVASSPALTNLIISGNSANNGGSGGGIYNNTSSPIVTNVNITGNTAANEGGGIYNFSTLSPVFTNVTITGNTAANQGGGVYNYGSSPVFTNVTISGNKANIGGSITNNVGSTPKFYNSIVYGNSSEAVNNSSTPEFYHSNIQGSGGSSNWVVATGTNGGNNLDVDPLFVLAPSHSTAPFTGGDYSLQGNSPVINAGRNSYYAGLAASTKDPMGNARVYNYAGGGVIDMGSYEYQTVAPNADGVVFVKKGSTGNGSNWANALGELADILKIAKTVTGIKQVWVAEGTYYPLYSAVDNNFGNNGGRNNAFLLVRDVKIYGGFAGTETSTMQRDTIGWSHKSILNGDIGTVGNNGDNAYHVVVSAGAVGTASLNGFTITGGNAGGGSEVTPTINGQVVRSFFCGGIMNYASSPALSNLIITGNSAENGGGGIGSLSSSSPVVTNVVINANTTNISGGGIYNSSSTPSFINTVVSGNSASYYGSGVFNSSSSAVFTNVTIASNKAGANGGAVYNTSSAQPRFYNSIVYGNSSGIINVSSGRPTFYNSIVQGSGGSSGWVAATGTDGGNNLAVDPLFILAPNNSGAPFTGGDYQLQSASPAINKGNNSYFTGLAETTTDLACKPRVSDYEDGALIDMGAYEYQTPIAPNADGVLFVKKGSKGKGGSWNKALGELGDALKVAKASTTIKQIWVAGGTYAPLYSPLDNNFGNPAERENAFLLVKDVQIYGGFAGTETAIVERDMKNVSNKSILSGDIGIIGDRSDNVYHVVVSSGEVGTAVLDGFTITGANASLSGALWVNSNPLSRDFGAGVYNFLSSPKLSNLVINNNSAVYGGGMYNYSSSPVLTNVLVNGNFATEGGGIYNNTSSPELINATLSGNAANSGGGMVNNSSSSPKLYNSIVYGNSTSMVTLSGTPEVYNSIIQGSGGSSSWVSATGLNGGSNLDVDPKFVAAPNYSTAPFEGGDYKLQATSPAINVGKNSYYTGLLATHTDLAGNLRVHNFASGGIIDMGAYEYQALLSQTINFAALNSKTTNSADFALSATSTSGLPVSYTSANTAIAQVYEDNGVWKVKIKAAGSVDITAKQQGDANYAAATDVKQNLVIIDEVLPVELISYTAKIANQTARLDWSVATESNNRKFVIYRSGDDRQFTQIGEVASLGNTTTNRSYFFVDKQPLNGNNYYKLVQVDLDGKPTELGLRTLSFSLSTFSVQLYPNPTKDKATVTFEAAKYASLVLSGIDGKVLKVVQLNSQQDKLEIDLSAYPTGIYFIKLVGTGESIVKKVIKQ